METTKAEETISDAGGNVQDVAGDTMCGSSTDLAGKAKELCGKAQQLCADTTNTARATMATNPFTALAVAAAVGFMLGAIWSRNPAKPDERAN